MLQGNIQESITEKYADIYQALGVTGKLPLLLLLPYGHPVHLYKQEQQI